MGSSFPNEQGHHRWGGQDDRETFVFTVEPSSSPKPTVETGVQLASFWSQKRKLRLVDSDPHPSGPVLVYVHEISVMEGHCRIINRPDDGPKSCSCCRSQSAHNQLPPNHLHGGRRAKLERCECHPSNTRWVLMDRHGRWVKSIRRKTVHAVLFSRPKVNATRYCQIVGGGTRR